MGLNYEFTFTVPSNTSKKNPYERFCKVSAGIVHLVEVYFPRGCAGLVHVKIFDDGHQIWPSNPEDDFNGDDTTISFNEYYKVVRGKTKFRVIAWNEDEIFDHTITVRFAILKEEEVNPWLVLSDLRNVFKTVFGI